MQEPARPRVAHASQASHGPHAVYSPWPHRAPRLPTGLQKNSGMVCAALLGPICWWMGSVMGGQEEATKSYTKLRGGGHWGGKGSGSTSSMGPCCMFLMIWRSITFSRSSVLSLQQPESA